MTKHTTKEKKHTTKETYYKRKENDHNTIFLKKAAEPKNSNKKNRDLDNKSKK